MGLGYQVSGSGNCDTIRMLALKLDTLTQRVRKVAEDRDLTLAERDEQIDALIDAYKTDVKLNFIQNRYGEASSYYAMFQEVGGQMVFNPVNDQSDITWFTALANSWEILYPQAPRTLNLQNIALQGHKNTRRRVLEINMDDEKVSETGIIDMGFPDKTGRERRLSELKGNVVLLDFTVYDMKGSQERTLALRELYNKYHERGFEIYQVSFDKSEHYWKTMSEQLPWVCVWDEEGLAHDIVQLYNLQSVPTWFLINRKPELVGRMELMDDLEKEIQRLL
jgi:peroxiredoxin